MKQFRTIRGLMAMTGVIAVYVVTWIGGYLAHGRVVGMVRVLTYKQFAYRNSEAEAIEAESGFKEFGAKIHDGGPRTGIAWCIPVLPGVLLVNSYRSVGPLYGSGGTKTVVFYCAGSFTLCELWG